MAWLLASCAQVQIEDVPFYGSLAKGGAVEFQTQTPGNKQITIDQWNALWNDIANTDGPMVCERSTYFAKTKAAIEQLCSQQNICVFKTNPQLAAFFSSVENFEQMAKLPNEPKP